MKTMMRMTTTTARKREVAQGHGHGGEAGGGEKEEGGAVEEALAVPGRVTRPLQNGHIRQDRAASAEELLEGVGAGVPSGTVLAEVAGGQLCLYKSQDKETQVVSTYSQE